MSFLEQLAANLAAGALLKGKGNTALDNDDPALKGLPFAFSADSIVQSLDNTTNDFSFVDYRLRPGQSLLIRNTRWLLIDDSIGIGELALYINDAQSPLIAGPGDEFKGEFNTSLLVAIAPCAGRLYYSRSSSALLRGRRLFNSQNTANAERCIAAFGVRVAHETRTDVGPASVTINPTVFDNRVKAVGIKNLIINLSNVTAGGTANPTPTVTLGRATDGSSLYTLGVRQLVSRGLSELVTPSIRYQADYLMEDALYVNDPSIGPLSGAPALNLLINSTFSTVAATWTVVNYY
jgi:hypothetical protein